LVFSIKTAAKFVGGYSHVTFLPEFFFLHSNMPFKIFRFSEEKKKKENRRDFKNMPIYQIPVMQIIIILGFFFFLVRQHSLKGKKFKIKSHF